MRRLIVFVLLLVACRSRHQERPAVRALLELPPPSVCDGVQDATSALQGLLDSARVNGRAGRVNWPAGVCLVSQTLRLRGVAGIILEGDGVMTTELRWTGGADSTLLLLDRVNRATLSDFSITVAPDKRLSTGIRIQQGAACSQEPGCTSWASSQNTVRDVVLIGERRLDVGIHVAMVEPDEKNDHHIFRNVQVQGFSQAAFRLQGKNAKALTLDTCLCQGWGVGLYCVDTPAPGAGFRWLNGASIGSAVTDFNIGSHNDTLLISGIYSEKSISFLNVAPDDDKVEYPIVLEAVRFATGDTTPEHGQVVVVAGAGPVSIIGGRWGVKWGVNGVRSPPVRFSVDPAARFVFAGNHVWSRNADRFPRRVPDWIDSNVMQP